MIRGQRAVVYFRAESRFGVLVWTARGWAREVIDGKRAWFTREDAEAATSTHHDSAVENHP